MKTPLFATIVLAGMTLAQAQINTGSTGSDGALDFSSISYPTNIVIDMHDHPTGIYNYTLVNIPTNVTVTFIPNANNTPAVWLVQNSCVLNGTVDVSGKSSVDSRGGLGGPGGYRGGEGVMGNSPATSGQGPGGGPPNGSGIYNYGNSFLVPLLGGSGGGGGPNCGSGGGGGGGAILIAAPNSLTVNGSVLANGGGSIWYPFCVQGGPGSGGAIRLVASLIGGTGSIIASGGAGGGRIRFDSFDTQFSGSTLGQFTRGFQPIIIPAPGQLPILRVASVGGVAVSPSPTGVIATPDAVIAAQQNNPIPVVVQCSNVPLNSQITVTVKPANGAAVSATGSNSSGTVASSTVTISINIPRGGGLIYATAATAP